MGRSQSYQEFKPSETALLVIDVQQGIFSRLTPVYNERLLLSNINTLIERFSQSGAKVYLVQHSNQKTLIAGTRNWKFHPDLNTSKADSVIHKTHGNAFKETNLKQTLDSHGIQKIMVTGLVTNGCVRATCIAGREFGFHVILVEDGHSSYSKVAAKLIRDWNRKLSEDFVDLYPTSDIKFR
jgi:nicotinamidase-related amidase